MFEKIITDVLNQHLGAYIDVVDKEQLGASIYSGSVSLLNVRLKATMFDSAPVPFSLRYGQIGRIYLKIPIWDMFSSPLVIEIEDVIGVVQIKPIQDWNEEHQRNAFVKRQQSILKQFEIYVQQKNLIEQTQKESSTSFSQKLVDRILNNL